MGKRTPHAGDGRAFRTDVPAPPTVAGPWSVRFQPGHGAPDRIMLDTPGSLSRHADAGVRHFAGTATYERTIDIPAHLGDWPIGERFAADGTKTTAMARNITALPDWYTAGRAKPPGGRVTFTPWTSYRPDEPLPDAGQLGPVRLVSARAIAIP